MSRLGIVLGVALLSVSAGAPAAPKGAPRTFTITVARLGFGPAPAGLKVGDVVEWINRDIFLHSATAKDGSFDVQLKPGAKGRTVLKRAGDIAYICSYHPGMTGVLKVAPR